MVRPLYGGAFWENRSFSRDFCKKLNHKETYMIFFVTLEGVSNDFASVFCIQNTLVKE